MNWTAYFAPQDTTSPLWTTLFKVLVDGELRWVSYGIGIMSPLVEHGEVHRMEMPKDGQMPGVILTDIGRAALNNLLRYSHEGKEGPEARVYYCLVKAAKDAPRRVREAFTRAPKDFAIFFVCADPETIDAVGLAVHKRQANVLPEDKEKFAGLEIEAFFHDGRKDLKGPTTTTWGKA